jgi:zinc transport system ATP-binding protein
MDQIVLDDVSFAYNAEPVLTEVNLRIGEREIVVIVGPNGSGKTTLLKLMLGLLRPSRGRVRVLGQAPDRVRTSIGYVPQQTQHDPHFPVGVLDVVLMGRLGSGAAGWYTAADRQAAERALADVDLAGSGDRPFGVLSGGQRQRVLIARALVSAPRLLLLDEPTSSVDQSTVQRLYGMLKAFSERMTVVFVSHDVGVVSAIVTSVVCVNRTVALHPTSRLTGETLAALYGGDMTLVRHDHRCAEAGHAHV